MQLKCNYKQNELAKVFKFLMSGKHYLSNFYLSFIYLRINNLHFKIGHANLPKSRVWLKHVSSLLLVMQFIKYLQAKLLGKVAQIYCSNKQQ